MGYWRKQGRRRLTQEEKRMDAKREVEQLAQRKAKDCFVKFNGTEKEVEEALGIAVSVWSKWDGLKVMRVFHAALEDANFHEEAAEVEELRVKTIKRFEKL